MILTITSVVEQANGQIKVTGTNDKGESRTKTIFSNSELAQTARSLNTGQVVNMKLGPQPYYNVLSISPATAADTQGGGGYKKPYNKGFQKQDNSLGMRVGNIVNNAVLLVTSGNAGNLDEAVDTIIALQASIEAKLTGSPPASSNSQANVTPQAQPVEPTVSYDDTSNNPETW